MIVDLKFATFLVAEMEFRVTAVDDTVSLLAENNLHVICKYIPDTVKFSFKGRLN